MNRLPHSPRVLLPLMIIAWASLSTSAVRGSDGDGGSDAAESPRPLVNDRCPVMNDEFASPTQEITFHGVAVRFCCGKCKRRFEEDPVPFLAHLPQLSPQTMQAIVAEAQGAARAAAVDDRVDRWTRPLLLTAAGLLAAWLVVRIARRRRRARGG